MAKKSNYNEKQERREEEKRRTLQRRAKRAQKNHERWRENKGQRNPDLWGV